MKLKGTKTEQVTIEINDKERKEIVINFLLEKFDLKSTHGEGYVYIKDGYLVDEWEEGGGQHSWFTDKKLRKPTRRDRRILAVIKDIE